MYIVQGVSKVMYSEHLAHVVHKVMYSVDRTGCVNLGEEGC